MPRASERRRAESLALMDAGLIATEELLRALLRQGLARTTAATEAEIRAIAQRAHFGGLIRLERQLDGLATLCERYRTRDPLFRTWHYTEALNQAWLVVREARLLRSAGDVPGVAELGEVRRTYAPVEGPLDVHALAAHGWVTDSAYVGITVTLRGPRGLLQVTNAKPTMYFGDDPGRLLWQPLSEHVAHSIGSIAHGSWTIQGARLSADGRLSLHRELVLTAAPSCGRDAYAGLEADIWADIIDRLEKEPLEPQGRSPAVVVFVQPHRWGPVSVDDTAARLRQPVMDRTGATLWVQLPLAPHTQLWVDNMRAIDSSKVPRPDALVGEVRVSAGELHLRPWTAVFYDAVELGGRQNRNVHEVHLGLESLERVRR